MPLLIRPQPFFLFRFSVPGRHGQVIVLSQEVLQTKGVKLFFDSHSAERPVNLFRPLISCIRACGGSNPGFQEGCFRPRHETGDAPEFR